MEKGTEREREREKEGERGTERQRLRQREREGETEHDLQTKRRRLYNILFSNQHNRIDNINPIASDERNEENMNKD